jgi:predicted nuclease of predicted toxin-antitoxin system
MKLLIDENISYRLVKMISDIFPESEQVKRLGMLGIDDLTIWKFAKDNNFSILTYDNDYEDLSNVLGNPPKVILLKNGNLSNIEIEAILRKNINDIQNFLNQDGQLLIGCLNIY